MEDLQNNERSNEHSYKIKLERCKNSRFNDELIYNIRKDLGLKDLTIDKITEDKLKGINEVEMFKVAKKYQVETTIIHEILNGNKVPIKELTYDYYLKLLEKKKTKNMRVNTNKKQITKRLYTIEELVFILDYAKTLNISKNIPAAKILKELKSKYPNSICKVTSIRWIIDNKGKTPITENDFNTNEEYQKYLILRETVDKMRINQNDNKIDIKHTTPKKIKIIIRKTK